MNVSWQIWARLVLDPASIPSDPSAFLEKKKKKIQSSCDCRTHCYFVISWRKGSYNFKTKIVSRKRLAVLPCKSTLTYIQIPRHKTTKACLKITLAGASSAIDTWQLSCWTKNKIKRISVYRISRSRKKRKEKLLISMSVVHGNWPL